MSIPAIILIVLIILLIIFCVLAYVRILKDEKNSEEEYRCIHSEIDCEDCMSAGHCNQKYDRYSLVRTKKTEDD